MTGIFLTTNLTNYLTADYTDYGDFWQQIKRVFYFTQKAQRYAEKGFLGDVNIIDDCEKILRISFISAWRLIICEMVFTQKAQKYAEKNKIVVLSCQSCLF